MPFNDFMTNSTYIGNCRHCGRPDCWSSPCIFRQMEKDQAEQEAKRHEEWLYEEFKKHMERYEKEKREESERSLILHVTEEVAAKVSLDDGLSRYRRLVRVKPVGKQFFQVLISNIFRNRPRSAG